MGRQVTVKEYFDLPKKQEKLEELLGERKSVFVTSLLQSVMGNKKLAQAEPSSIFMAACVAAALDLPINQQLGFAYIVPYEKSNGKDNRGKWLPKTIEAQFQLGYKGYVQLAQRTGKFKNIDACAVYEGDDEKSIRDRLTLLFPEVPPSENIIGYVAYFKLLNGFEARLSMRMNEVYNHAKEYSTSFQYANGDKSKEKNSIWHTNTDAMAKKTVIKLLLSKQAPLSITSSLNEALEADQAVIRDVNGYPQYDYVDNNPNDYEHDYQEQNQANQAINVSNNPLMFSNLCEAVIHGKITKESVRNGNSGYILNQNQLAQVEQL